MDEGGFGAEKALFIGIEDDDEGDFGDVEPFAKKVDADEDIEFAQAQVDLMICIRSRVSISEWRYLAFTPISLRYLERSSESFLVRVVTRTRPPFFGFLADFFEAIVDLACGGADFDCGIEKAGGADDLLDDIPFALARSPTVPGWRKHR